MFSGIVEKMGKVVGLEKKGSSLIMKIESELLPKLHVDQSISHNGVCLTIEKVFDDSYQLTAVEETLKKTNLGDLKVGDSLNLERSLQFDDRFDGHIVQGHIDSTAVCTKFKEADGSWYYTFKFKPGEKFLLVEKGSVSIDGVSLTAFDVNNKTGEFTVAIIPYTYEVTNFQFIREGTKVNIEFDVLGKYIFTWLESYQDMMKDK
ncbi:MAG: riboflavin synthase, partial [Bacteroidota bacterium]|nr:riboflavin synthase [Bacteroidota bacterium]